MTDLEIMLAAWRSWLRTGSRVARDVALELADRDRTRRTTAKEVKS